MLHPKTTPVTPVVGEKTPTPHVTGSLSFSHLFRSRARERSTAGESAQARDGVWDRGGRREGGAKRARPRRHTFFSETHAKLAVDLEARKGYQHPSGPGRAVGVGDGGLGGGRDGAGRLGRKEGGRR